MAVSASLFPCVTELAEHYAGEGRAAPQLVVGSSGKLAAQIAGGAPYGLFLSADLEWLEYLRKKGLVERIITLAESPLVMWWLRSSPPKPSVVGERLRVAIADPQTAPFGRAARGYLEQLGWFEKLVEENRLIVTADVLQAVLAVQSGGADLAFTSLSVTKKLNRGSTTILSEYKLVHAGAFITGKASRSLEAFWAYLRSAAAFPVWQRWGFYTEVPP
ncbi:MAG: molybdate ABC transporter substrate-binding protein [Spirochaetota bacterium]